VRIIISAQACFLLILAGIWEGLVLLGVDETLLPPINKVLSFVYIFLTDPGFLSDLGVTAIEIVVAFAISVPIAVATGIVVGESRRLERAINPFIYLALAIPQSVFLPIFILLFGIGFVEKVVFGITYAYFVIVMNAFAAVRSVPQNYIMAARSFGASPKQIYLRIYLPAMLPLVLTGLRLGLIFCIIGVLLTEMYSSRFGIGHRLFGWGESYQIPQLIAGVMIISVVTITLSEGMRFLEVRATRRYGALSR
jgi:ABC-type nitrate/sulfonate/bicarbonate transport system permease component